jgi:4a-hydroxytetrahydrobiopterin dehydratase
VLGYADEKSSADAQNAVIDPFFQGPAVWFQQMDVFWVLADPEGNEACITTWQGRD